MENINYWIFQSNPKRYRILELLVDPKIPVYTWGIIPQYSKTMKKGDIVLIWMSGKAAGIYAVAKILTDPKMITCKPGEKYYFLNKKDKLRNKGLGVELNSLKKMINNPIYRTELKHTRGLERLSIFRFGQKANFLITEKQWQIILEKILSR
jgi:predicted RNA-binding protein with PUA-like domain